MPIAITGLGALSGLGSGVEDHRRSIAAGDQPFRPLGELLGAGSPHAALPGAWIEDRRRLTHRKWSPVTMAALIVARQAVVQAGWTAAELRDAALVVGTSRGNAAGWLGPWPGRRPFAVMAASNTIHSEPATAVGIEFGMTGPNHVVASGCAAGLDALGIAWMHLRCGLARRALVVAVDLPLVPLLLDNYAASGLLARDFEPDPYHVRSRGFIPAEGAAAMAIETGSSQGPQLRGYACNADAADPVGIPVDGGGTTRLAIQHLADHGPVAAVCPHATGTAVQATADPAWLARVFPEGLPTLHLLKPFLGHTIGASGLLESVILARFIIDGMLPPNIPGLHAPPGFTLPSSMLPATGAVMKVSHGMGGHNAIVSIAPS
jgi:3-oxoacyl-[acyl-carrier-protein] synthase II